MRIFDNVIKLPHKKSVVTNYNYYRRYEHKSPGEHIIIDIPISNSSFLPNLQLWYNNPQFHRMMASFTKDNKVITTLNMYL